MSRKMTTAEFVEKARAVHGDLYDYSKVNYKGANKKVIIGDPDFPAFEQIPSSHLKGYGNPHRSGNAKSNTEDFIRKARVVHGDLYDYSKVKYVNNSTKVIIGDPDFPSFEQTPSDHLRGYGNPHRKKSNTEDFIRKARVVHGDFYDYSAVEYKGAHKKVIIGDPDFPSFEQTPSIHLSGYGNPHRSRAEKTSDTEEFIRKARLVHGDLYDYSEVKYVNSRTPVIIGDPDFPSFEQIPSSHLRGHGNPHRGGMLKSNTEEFIRKARAVHGDFYDYSEVKYVNNHTKVIIGDPDFPSFEQTPSSHLSGAGNPHRGGNLKSTTEDFIRKARLVHGNLYDYSEVDYRGAHKKVIICDPIFGPFKQTPDRHLSGCGNPDRPYTRGTKIYLLEFETQTEHFAKIGVMKHTPEVRFTGVDAEITSHFIHDFECPNKALQIEKNILKYLREQGIMQVPDILQSNGHTECFSVNALPDVRQKLETITLETT